MKGTIIDLSRTPAGNQQASVRTDYGILIGAWEGDVPSLSSIVFFEIDFEPKQALRKVGLMACSTCELGRRLSKSSCLQSLLMVVGCQ
jgi:hypothetical protein